MMVPNVSLVRYVVVSAAFALFRLANGPSLLSPFGVNCFKDATHVWVGMVLMGWLWSEQGSQCRKDLRVMFWALSAVEVVSAVIYRFVLHE